MSRVSIQGIVDNIKSNSNVYTPLVEGIVNAIDAIKKNKTGRGQITVTIIRAGQTELTMDSLAPVYSIEIHDNGQGFTSENRDSFDTLHSDFKVLEGGKG